MENQIPNLILPGEEPEINTAAPAAEAAPIEAAPVAAAVQAAPVQAAPKAEEAPMEPVSSLAYRSQPSSALL